MNKIRFAIRHAETVIAAVVCAAVLTILLTCHGCTAQQLATVQSDANRAARVVQTVIVAYRANEATIDDVAAAAAVASPKLGSQILQAALLVKQNAATVDTVEGVAASIERATRAPDATP